MVVWLANNGNPPTGRTGAPFNGNCNDCHTGGNFGGNVEITGLPATIEANTTYDLNIKLTATVGSPLKAGFQVVVVDNNNANCGDLINITGNGTGTENLASREYMEHRNGKSFAGGMVTWDFQWRSPASVPGNVVKLYYIGNFCNGTGGTGGDNPLWGNETYTFAGSPPLAASISDQVNPSCNGANNGSATVEATGGATPYTYLWTGGQTTQTATNLTAGTYTCTVTGAMGSGTATAVAVLTQPTAMTLSTNVSGSVTCVDVATATATATGGTPGYTYAWSDGQTGDVATFDMPGGYVVTATDANGCTKVASVNITGNTTPPVAVAGPGAELTCQITQVQLNGTGSSTGGNFTYLWTTLNGNILSGATTLTPTVNQCGTYTLTVTNTNNGCTATASTTVTCLNTPPTAMATGGVITCANPIISLTGSSDTPNVSFFWTGPGIDASNQNDQNPEVDADGVYTLRVTDNGTGCTKTASATVSADIVQPTATASVSGTLTCIVSSVQLNLMTNAQNPSYGWTGPNNFTSNIPNPSVSVPGDYIGTVTNTVNGCSSRDTITVVQNTATPGATALVSGQINCANASVQLLGNSPAAPAVTFAWAGPDFSSTEQNPAVDTAGVYTLTITGNANGCTSTAVATVLQNFTPPFDSIVPPANLNCNNASIELNATPSSQGPNFDYLWTVKNGGHIVSGDTTLTPEVDSAGRYILTITNINNGCKAVDSVDVALSPVVTATISASSNVRCNGGADGSATAAGAGGNGVFNYLWSNGATTAQNTGLATGTYLVSVTDGENCSAVASVVITQPELLVANATATGETALGANNGTATANPGGGTPAYTYLWSNGATTQTITNLAPGSYTVAVGDANGCTALQTVTVNAFGCSLQANISTVNVSCNGAQNGTASVSLNGAANPVSFSWSNGATTQTVGNLAPGLYTVSVLDGNNCPAVLSAGISEPPVLSANASATGVSANGAGDGTATATPAGGTPGYTYLWSNGQTSAGITGLAPGAYTVVVTDANNCTTQQTVNVAAFNCALTANISSSNVNCFNSADGLATVTVSGGLLPYTYLWNNGSTNQTIANLPVGSYTVLATDAAGCSIEQTATITQPEQLVATVQNIQHVACPQDQTGSATIQASGGVMPYIIQWPGGNAGNLGVGNYTVSVTDANNCTATVSFSIVSMDNTPPEITCPSDISVCGEVSVEYPTPSVFDNCGTTSSPVLMVGLPSGAVFPLGTTIVGYRAFDGSLNSSECTFLVFAFPPPEVTVDNVTNDMNSQSLGAISITASGGNLSYQWFRNGQPFSENEDLGGLAAGVYTLVVTDNNGCSTTLPPIEISNVVGTNEPGQAGAIRLWPNPTTSYIRLEIIDLDIIALQLVDVRGRLVQTIPPSEWAGEIQVGDLPSGMYCIRANTAQGRVLTLKFVKE
jgi:hypothetical protein